MTLEPCSDVLSQTIVQAVCKDEVASRLSEADVINNTTKAHSLKLEELIYSHLYKVNPLQAYNTSLYLVHKINKNCM